MFIDQIRRTKHYLRYKRTWGKLDLTGFKIGMLEYRRRARKQKGLWWAMCICGTEVLVPSPYRVMQGGRVRMDCGCSGDLAKDFASFPANGYINLPQYTIDELDWLYNVWKRQIVRPIKVKTEDEWLFHNGIVHCEPRWLSFYGFAEDVGIPPEHHTILRKKTMYRPLGKDNFYWSAKGLGHTGKTATQYLFRSTPTTLLSYELSQEMHTLSSFLERTSTPGSLWPFVPSDFES